ncbi:MAG TPA: hydroxymethylbilane synthase, partial [Vicinamibacterales bacterium]
GTRGSQLALFQARSVADLLRERTRVACEIVVIRTSGDRLAEAALSEIGGKRLFVKEIEDALLSGEIDLAVHSSKDMPAVLPEGLALGAVLPREDPRDAVVLPAGDESGAGLTGPPRGLEGSAPHSLSLEQIVTRLGRSPRIGTTSVRRSAQLTRLLPGARFLPVRGNLGTRLAKLDGHGDFDALVLAAAGLKRLHHESRISALLPVDACVPAPGQGIIAVEVRAADHHVVAPLAAIDDARAAAALDAERAVVIHLGGGCQMPIGAYAALDDGDLALTAVVVSVDGARAARAEARGPAAAARAIGVQAAEQLLARGAGEILADVQRAQGAVEGLQP